MNKISSETLAILKNFATINESIIIHPGNKLNTCSPTKNMVATAEIAETFPKEAAIYNLNQFLSTVSLFNDPDFDFKDTHLIISDDNSSVKYFYADSSVIDITNRTPNMPDPVLEFTLTNEDLSALIKASSVMNLEDMNLSPNTDGEMILSVTNNESDSSNVFSRVVGDNKLDEDFTFYFKSNDLRLIPGDYSVAIGGPVGPKKRFLSRFTKVDNSIQYFVALEPKSKLG